MRVLIRPDWAGDFTMKRIRHTAEQIIRKLKTAEQLIAQGKTVADVCRAIEVTSDSPTGEGAQRHPDRCLAAQALRQHSPSAQHDMPENRCVSRVNQVDMRVNLMAGGLVLQMQPRLCLAAGQVTSIVTTMTLASMT